VRWWSFLGGVTATIVALLVLSDPLLEMAWRRVRYAQAVRRARR